jgi:hypothetical protein
MPTLTTADYLKYANLQMAAEASIRDPDSGQLASTGQPLINALIAGNEHASKFTQAQAEDFTDEWQVVDQKPNTTTGFSGCSNN